MPNPNPQPYICNKPIVLGEISRATGISLSHLSRIANGNRWPSFDTANQIATYLGVTLDELYYDLKQKVENRG